MWGYLKVSECKEHIGYRIVSKFSLQNLLHNTSKLSILNFGYNYSGYLSISYSFANIIFRLVLRFSKLPKENFLLEDFDL